MSKENATGKKASPISRMGKIFLAYRRHLQRRLVPHDITLKQVYLLKQLSRRQFLYPCDLAEMLFCDRPTASVVVRNMERRGWVQRTPDPENRRRVRVAITGAGREKQRTLGKWQEGAACDPAAALNDREKGQLERLLLKMEEGLGQPGK